MKLMERMKAISVVIILILNRFVRSIPIDNGVEGQPQVTCSPDSTALIFLTRNPFNGRIFVKGRYGEEACSQDYTDLTKAPTNNVSIIVPFDACGSVRTRSANPRGVFLINTIVIQFHPLFLTKVDRAYQVQCFYMEAEKTVTSSLEVSMLTTQSLIDQAPMPICTYSVHRESFDGPQARFFRIGESVFHRWQCKQPDGSESPFGMLVHTCVVSDGSNEQIILVDEQGCSMDPYILGHLTYAPDLLTAFREAHVFKFADRTELNFQCQIRLCHKSMGTCSGMTPPNCLELINRRRRRRLRHLDDSFTSDNSTKNREDDDYDLIDQIDSFNGPEFDVMTNTLIVLDPEEFHMGLERFTNATSVNSAEQSDDYCFPRTTFRSAVYLCILWLISILLAACIFTAHRCQIIRTAQLHKLQLNS